MHKNNNIVTKSILISIVTFQVVCIKDSLSEKGKEIIYSKIITGILDRFSEKYDLSGYEYIFIRDSLILNVHEYAKLCGKQLR